MSLPNFLIIGAAKAGTNALYHYLRQHPQVYMSPWKEPKFFAFESETDAPPCSECGSIMVRRGACYACFNCGTTSGCS